MDMMDEDEMWDIHGNWLAKHFPNATINEGWVVDEVDGYIASKVYGHGIVTTYADGHTSFEEFSAD